MTDPAAASPDPVPDAAPPSTPPAPAASIEERLAALEGSHRIQRLVITAMVPVLAGAVWIAWSGRAASPPEAPAAASTAQALVRTQAVVIDDGGKLRAELALEEDGSPMLRLNGQGGEPQAAFGVGIDGTSGLSLYDPRGTPRLGFGVFRDETVGVVLFDATARRRAEMILADDGSPRLRFFDATGATILELPDGE